MIRHRAGLQLNIRQSWYDLQYNLNKEANESYHQFGKEDGFMMLKYTYMQFTELHYSSISLMFTIAEEVSLQIIQFQNTTLALSLISSPWFRWDWKPWKKGLKATLFNTLNKKNPTLREHPRNWKFRNKKTILSRRVTQLSTSFLLIVVFMRAWISPNCPADEISFPFSCALAETGSFGLPITSTSWESVAAPRCLQRSTLSTYQVTRWPGVFEGV